MKTILIILWLLIGIISVWRTYFGIQKYWYDKFNSTMQEDKCFSHNLLLILSPIFILVGLLTFLYFNLVLPQAWYFKKPK